MSFNSLNFCFYKTRLPNFLSTFLSFIGKVGKYIIHTPTHITIYVIYPHFVNNYKELVAMLKASKGTQRERMQKLCENFDRGSILIMSDFSCININLFGFQV